jgi:hypothetical protein
MCTKFCIFFVRVHVCISHNIPAYVCVCVHMWATHTTCVLKRYFICAYRQGKPWRLSYQCKGVLDAPQADWPVPNYIKGVTWLQTQVIKLHVHVITASSGGYIVWYSSALKLMLESRCWIKHHPANVAPVTLIGANETWVLKTKDYNIRIIKMDHIKVDRMKCVQMVLARRNNHVTLRIKQIYLDMEKGNLCFVNIDTLICWWNTNDSYKDEKILFSL